MKMLAIHLNRHAQIAEIAGEFVICERMRNTVPKPRQQWDASSLYLPKGLQKYLNQAERSRALAAVSELDEDQQLFALVLAWSGARISEVLALSAASFQLDTSLVAIRTLKRRRHHVREVPLPPSLVERLDAFFRTAQAAG